MRSHTKDDVAERAAAPHSSRTSTTRTESSAGSGRLDALQRLAGNQAVTNMLQRQGGPQGVEKDPPGKVVPAPVQSHLDSILKIAPMVKDGTAIPRETGEQLQQRMKALNVAAEADFQRRLKRRDTMTSPEIEWKAKLKQDEEAKAILKNQFGDTWGTIFWWTRGGGETGEGSPLWGVLEGLSNFSKAAAPRPPRVPPAFPIESAR